MEDSRGVALRVTGLVSEAEEEEEVASERVRAGWW